MHASNRAVRMEMNGEMLFRVLPDFFLGIASGPRALSGSARLMALSHPPR